MPRTKSPPAPEHLLVSSERWKRQPAPSPLSLPLLAPNSSPLEADDLARLHDVERIERPLDRARGGERGLAVLGREIPHLALADAVLAGAGAVHRQRSLDQAFEERLHPRLLVGVAEIDAEGAGEKVPPRTGRRRGAPSRFSAISRCVSVTHSASREIGTQTSVAMPKPVERRLARPPPASCRARHTR